MVVGKVRGAGEDLSRSQAAGGKQAMSLEPHVSSNKALCQNWAQAPRPLFLLLFLLYLHQDKTEPGREDLGLGVREGL